MSKTIDERVVEMRFDNSQFEKNVSTSMSTLQKLKQSLNLKDASKGLDNISNAAKKFDLSPMGNGIETVKAKFSALEVMAVTALANITNSAVNAGKRLVSAFTIEPIKMGFQEYETQINAVQTILSNTRSKGTTLDQVNAALDELNTYADKTIYNFTEMTRNIGTFTAAGVDLDTSVSAIKGIANLAAVSGSNSQQASTAMYQLSQALAAGTVKLMDWNSVVNAGMGGQVFQDALKETARVHGIAIDQMIEDNGSFRETLQEGWLSSEILTETLAKFTGDLTESQILSMGYTKEQAKEIMALGQDANDAATKVKTFTQLMDTLKEAVQSGWTQSWEIIIGDFEEAKALWTSVSDTMGEMINRSAEARNAVLEGWAQAGGRSMAIEAIKNAFEALVSVIKPIKEAFREIFPPTTAAQLVNMTKAVRDFTEKLKLNKAQSENLKATFKGLFAVVDILWTVFKELVSGAVRLVGAFTGMGSGILGVTGSLGDMLVNLRNTVKETDLFGKAIDFIVRVVQNGVGKVKEFAGYLRDLADGIEAPGLVDSLAIFSKVGDFCNKAIRQLSNFVSSLMNSLGNLLSSENVDAFINGGMFTAILLGVKKFIDEMNSITEKGSFLNGIKETLNDVRECFESYQQNLQADTLMKIAGAIGILAASLFLLATIDPDRLGSAIAGMTALFGELIGSMALLNKMDITIKKTSKIIAMMIGMSAAILILSIALKRLSGIDTGDMVKSILGIAALSAIVVKSAEAMSKDGPKVIKGATGLILFAAAIKVLASACKDISSLSWMELAKGLVGVSVLMAAVSVFTNKTEFGPKTIANAASIVVLSVALKIMASACKDLGSMNIPDLVKGLGSIALLLGGIYLFVDKVGDTKMLISTGVALVLLGAAMKTFASAIQNMGSMSWSELAKGLIGFAGALGAVTLALNLMPKNESMIKIGAGLAIISISLVIMASAMQKLGSMTWGEVAKGLVALAGSLTILAVALAVMNIARSGASALFVAAAGLCLLAPALRIMGEMSMWSIVKSLIALAGALVILGAASIVLAPFVPVVLAVGAAIALIGVGLALMTASMIAASSAIVAFTSSIASVAAATSFISSLTIIIVGIANLIPLILRKVGEGIVALCQAIGDGASAIANMVLQVGSSVLNTLTQLIPQFVQFVVTLVDEFLKTVAEKAPSIIQSGIDILVAFISGISNNIDKVVSAATDLIINFMNTIANKAMEIAQAGADIAINLINGMAEGIRNNAQAAHDAISNLCSAILDAVLIFFGIHSPSTVFAEIGGNLIQGLINGIGGLASSAVNTVKTLAGNLVNSVGSKAATFLAKGRELMSNLRNGISNKLGDVRNAVTKVVSNAVKTVASKASQFTAKGKELMFKLKSGVSNGSSSVKTAVTNVAKDMLSALKSKVSEFKTIGSNMIKGLKKGIESAAKGAVNAAKGVAKNAIEGAKKLLKINSPSKVFLSMGKSVDEGFVMGIEADASKVRDASVSMSKDAINGAKKAVSAVGKVIANGVNSNPSISPVVDMDSIKTSGLNIGANVSAIMSKPITSVAQILDKAQAEINESNNRVIEAVNGLRDDMNRFYTESDQEIALYVDSRKLATSIAKPMNRELNILSKRGAY